MKKYMNKIYKHKTEKTLFRAIDAYPDVVVLKPFNSEYNRILNENEIEVIFECCGEAKYSDEELEKMKYEFK